MEGLTEIIGFCENSQNENIKDAKRRNKTIIITRLGWLIFFNSISTQQQIYFFFRMIPTIAKTTIIPATAVIMIRLSSIRFGLLSELKLSNIE